jgi:hypothetical protein
MTTPTRAYDLLEAPEKRYVDEYVRFAVDEQNRLRERIIHALYKPIPNEFVRRSKGNLSKPLILAAVSERIKEEADSQDISPDRVISEHAAIAFGDIYRYYTEDDFGQLRPKQMSKLTAEERRAVKSIEVKDGMYGLSHKITMHDKQVSLKAMGEMMGLVAPDRPPPLQEYIKPLQVGKQSDEADAPGLEYIRMLEGMSA